MAALGHGLPLVCLPMSADQPIIAGRAVALGAGLSCANASSRTARSRTSSPRGCRRTPSAARWGGCCARRGSAPPQRSCAPRSRRSPASSRPLSRSSAWRPPAPRSSSHDRTRRKATVDSVNTGAAGSRRWRDGCPSAPPRLRSSSARRSPRSAAGGVSPRTRPAAAGAARCRGRRAGRRQRPQHRRRPARGVAPAARDAAHHRRHHRRRALAPISDRHDLLAFRDGGLRSAGLALYAVGLPCSSGRGS